MQHPASGTTEVDLSDPRVHYCREKKLHHLFELLATKVLDDRPENPFLYLREQLQRIETAEAHKHDPTVPAGCRTGTDVSVTIAVLGLDNAGKSAFINALSGACDQGTSPTVGFSPTSFAVAVSPSADAPPVQMHVSLYDLGGGGNFRGIWRHYFHDCHAFIFVVDAADAGRLQEARSTLRSILDNPLMMGKSFLLVANKSDLASCLPLDQVEHGLLSDCAPAEKQEAESTVSTDMSEKQRQEHIVVGPADYRAVKTCSISGAEADVEVRDSAVEWLLREVLRRYEELNVRVNKDTAAAKEKKKRQMEQQRARLQAHKAQEDAERQNNHKQYI